MTMLGSITVLLVCQLLGEIAAKALHLPVPGPVLGMVILFAGLIAAKGVPRALDDAGNTLLSHLSLLFIPAGVGIVVHFDLIKQQLPAVAGGLLIGTAATIAVTGWVMNRFLRAKAPDRD